MREGFFARWRQADDGAFQLVLSAHAGPINVEAWRKEGKIPLPESQTCVCPVMTSQKHATASLASGNVREPAAGSDWQRPSMRERSSTTLACHVPNVLITMRSQNMCRTCSVLCVFFSLKALVHTSTWARINAHHASSLMFLASAFFFCGRRLVTCVAKFVDLDSTTPFFFFANIFSVCFFLFQRRVCRPVADNDHNFILFFFFCVIIVLFFDAFFECFLQHRTCRRLVCCVAIQVLSSGACVLIFVAFHCH